MVPAGNVFEIDLIENALRYKFNPKYEGFESQR